MLPGRSPAIKTAAGFGIVSSSDFPASITNAPHTPETTKERPPTVTDAVSLSVAIIQSSRTSQIPTGSTATLSGSVLSNGASQQETSHTPQDTGTPTPSAEPQPGSSPAPQSRANRAAFIAPICIGTLALFFLSGVLYFRVTRKRWPFTGHRAQILEPYHTERVEQAMARTKNQPSNGASGLGNSSGGSAENTQRVGYPLIAHQPESSSAAPILGEQLEHQSALTNLVREVENIKQLLGVGTQTIQHADQTQNDQPPDYSSQPEFAEAQPPGVTREKMRDS